MNPDQTAPMSDLGPHCLTKRLLKHFCRQQKQTTLGVIDALRVQLYISEPLSADNRASRCGIFAPDEKSFIYIDNCIGGPHMQCCRLLKVYIGGKITIEPRHEISNNVVCVTSKASDQPAQMRSLIRAFSSHLNIL